MKSIIHAYILCYNEEHILPYTLDYYSKYCRQIFLLDNYSTDSSEIIAQRYPLVRMIKWRGAGGINELEYIQLKSSIYKKSRGNADFVIVADADEFIFNLEFADTLLENGQKLPQITGFQMVSEDFPAYDGQLITEKLKIGVRDRNFDKQVIFSPDLDVKFGVGAHTAEINPPQALALSNMYLLHYKWLGPKYVHFKSERNFQRLSDINKAKQWGIHYSSKAEENFNTWKKYFSLSSRIIP